jgi:hypothetical protein
MQGEGRVQRGGAKGGKREAQSQLHGGFGLNEYHRAREVGHAAAAGSGVVFVCMYVCQVYVSGVCMSGSYVCPSRSKNNEAIF